MEVSAQEITIGIKDFDGVEIDSGLQVNFIDAEDNIAVISRFSREEVRLYTETKNYLLPPNS